MGEFSSFKTGPAFAGLASEGFDTRSLFPTRPRRNYAKEVSLDWDKVLKNLKRSDKAYAEQAARALAATEAYRPRVPNASKLGSAMASAPDAVIANNRRVANSGALGKNVKVTDIRNMMQGVDPSDLDAEGRQLYRQMERAKREIKRMGEEPHEDGPGVLDRIFDIVTRGQYAAVNAIEHSNKTMAKALKDGLDLGDADDILKSTLGVAALPAAWEGLSGKKKASFQQLLKKPVGKGGYGLNPTNTAGKIGVGILGFALDVGLDPTTYIGVGAAKAAVQGGKAATKVAKAGDVAKKVTTDVGTLKKIHKELDKILDLDLDKVGYRQLDETGKPNPHARLATDRDLRREQITLMFTSLRKADGSPVDRAKVASQLRQAEHFLAYASKAKLAENAEQTAEVLKRVSTADFLNKSARQVWEHFEGTAVAGVLKDMARQGKVFRDVPVNTVVKATLNPEKVVKFEAMMNKKMGVVKAKITKAKKAGKPQEEIDALKSKLLDLEEEATYHKIYGKPIDDAAPDERIWNVVRDDSIVKEVVEHNKLMAKELEARVAEFKPKGIEEVHTALLEIAARELDPAISRLIQVRFGGLFGGSGAVLATFKAPDVFRKAAEKFAREGYDKEALNLYNKGVIGFSKAFRASGSLDQFIDAERLRTAGRANELIHIHVEDLRNKFGKIKKSDRNKIFAGFLKGVQPEALPDELTPIMQDVSNELADMQKIFDGSMYDQIGEVTWQDLNKWLPSKRVKLVSVNDPSLPVGSLEWWRLALRETTSHDVAEVLHQIRIAKEKMIARGTLTNSIENTLGISRFSPSGESALFHQLKNEKNYVTVKGFSDDIVFSPEIAQDLHRLLELVDDQAKHQDILKGFDKALNIWKSAVTVYNPAFHIRNSGGDMFVSYLNGMFIGRGGMKRAMKSHTAAMKTMRALKWSKIDPAQRINMMDTNPAFTGEALQDIGVGVHVLTVPRAFAGVGDKITAEQLWGAYLKYGLKQAFTSTEFGKIVSGTRGARGAASAANEAVRGVSEGREDWFRLAHFADVLQRESLTERSFERAAAKAAEDVRKFHFDYSDFTPFERAVLIRAIPFYKWTRKSLPLMVEMMFAKPGAMAVYPKGMSNLSQMMGYPVGDDPLMPDSDAIIPDWIKNRGAVPLYTSEKGNTVFFDPSNPFNDTVRTWQGDNPREFLTGQAQVQALLSMSNPIFRVPVELAQGRTFFGDYPIEGQEKQYLAGQSPQTNFIMKQFTGDNSDQPAADRLTNPETLNKILAAGTIENTPRAMEGELRRLNDILNAQRKKVRQQKGRSAPR
jgi:hypothetical protein